MRFPDLKGVRYPESTMLKLVLAITLVLALTESAPTTSDKMDEKVIEVVNAFCTGDPEKQKKILGEVKALCKTDLGPKVSKALKKQTIEVHS